MTSEYNTSSSYVGMDNGMSKSIVSICNVVCVLCQTSLVNGKEQLKRNQTLDKNRMLINASVLTPHPRGVLRPCLCVAFSSFRAAPWVWVFFHARPSAAALARLGPTPRISVTR